MIGRILGGVLLLAVGGCNQTGGQTLLASDPAPGKLRAGTKVLVDDGSCAEGQVKQLTGSTPGVPRRSECVARPS